MSYLRENCERGQNMKNRVLGFLFVSIGILLMASVLVWPFLQRIDPIYRIPLYFPSLVISAVGLYFFRISTGNQEAGK